MYQDLLPIGSVVLLAEGDKRLMICGRVVAREGEDEVFDYMGCFFPEGITDLEHIYFFNRDDIEMVFFIGLQDTEELLFRAEVLGTLGEVKVLNDESETGEE